MPSNQLISLKVREAALQAEIARTEASYLRWRLAEVQAATLRLLMVDDDYEWEVKRAALADTLRQGNTRCAWFLEMKNDPNDTILYSTAAEEEPDVTPAMLGVTETSTPDFLDGLDFGGRDQGKVADLLASGDHAGAENHLVNELKYPGDTNRAYILTGGPLARRRANAASLSDAFPHMLFVAIHPETEGLYTMRAVEHEIQRLVNSSGGELTHALLIAKGSTDLHLYWLSAEGGVADGIGCNASVVHRKSQNKDKTEPSVAKEVFLSFVHRHSNAELLEAAEGGKLAVIFAGESTYCIGKKKRAKGNYFRRLKRSELEESDPELAWFERFVGLEWQPDKIRCFLGGRRAVGEDKNCAAYQQRQHKDEQRQGRVSL